MRLLAAATVSHIAYAIANVSAEPMCTYGCMTTNFSVKGIDATSSGRTPNEGGPGHQLSSPSSVLTSESDGVAA